MDLKLNKTYERNNYSVTEEDMETGLTMYYIINFCDEEVFKLRQFLENVVMTQNRGAVLLAIVNTLQSKQISFKNKVFLGDVYKAVEKMFDLQLGKHLLGLSSLSQLNSIMDQDLPYLGSHEKAVKQCLNEMNCQEVENLTKRIGIML